jgi:hypothetical protein
MKKLFTKNNENFYFKVIETEKEFRQNFKTIELLDKLAIEAFIDRDKKLQKENGKIINMPKKEELWSPNENWIKNSFGTDENRKIFVIENENGDPVQVSIALFNDPKSIKNIEVEAGTFVYITSIVTAEEYKGKGFLGQMFNKILTYTENPKRNYEPPFKYATSITQTPCLIDGEIINEVINLDTYANMWLDRLENNKIQIRFQDIDNASNQYGREIFDLKDFFNGNEIKRKEISDLIDSKKEEAKSENRFVRGLYLIAEEPRNYIETKAFKKIKQDKFLQK